MCVCVRAAKDLGAPGPHQAHSSILKTSQAHLEYSHFYSQKPYAANQPHVQELLHLGIVLCMLLPRFYCTQTIAIEKAGLEIINRKHFQKIKNMSFCWLLCLTFLLEFPYRLPGLPSDRNYSIANCHNFEKSNHIGRASGYSIKQLHICIARLNMNEY